MSRVIAKDPKKFKPIIEDYVGKVITAYGRYTKEELEELSKEQTKLNNPTIITIGVGINLKYSFQLKVNCQYLKWTNFSDMRNLVTRPGLGHPQTSEKVNL